ncbi:PucR family transcriptional regulator [Nocardia arizonensis]|uniref:PucR family transcriptional regulator n=1 Tax=Nocardia arizonensis TaxID=1141647 RepID=UPI0006CF7F80|nr:helix-turn-helix domain-containing protein [Nocardia arizonensis]
MTESYAVLAITVSPDPDSTAGSDAEIAARQGLRRVEAAFETLFGDAARARWSARCGTAVVPVTDRGGDRFDDSVAALAIEARLAVTAALVFTTPARVAQGVDHAHELLNMVHRLRLRPRLYRFDDLALEFQLTRPGPGRDRLDAVLAPLGERAVLLDTLRCYVANSQMRGRTAQQLKVHPNTVDNRLKRIGQLTGHDPLQPDGIWCLRSALIVRAYHRGAAAPSPLPGFAPVAVLR